MKRRKIGERGEELEKKVDQRSLIVAEKEGEESMRKWQRERFLAWKAMKRKQTIAERYVLEEWENIIK